MITFTAYFILIMSYFFIGFILFFIHNLITGYLEKEYEINPSNSLYLKLNERNSDSKLILFLWPVHLFYITVKFFYLKIMFNSIENIEEYANKTGYKFNKKEIKK